jgi:hypothetical protein
MDTGRVQRDGFEWGYGRFRVLHEQTARYSVDALSKMFLPTISAEGKRAISKDRNFVKTQLKYYGIRYDGHEYKGNGVNLVKKALEAGQFDSVPNSILNLEQQLRREWLSTRTLTELREWDPAELVKFYFLDATGKPDKTMTPEGLAVPLPTFSMYRASLLTDAIGEVQGLNSRREGDILLIAWDESGIAKARMAGHAANRQAEEALKKEDRDRAQSRTDRHERYLRALALKPSTSEPSPVGQYLVHCQSIEDEWPDTKKVDMTLSIKLSRQAGIYEASFDVGAAVGPMMMSTDRGALEAYMVDMSNVSGDDEDSDDDGAGDLGEDTRITDSVADPEVTTTLPLKRKGSGLASDNTKKTKLTSVKNFHTVYKSRETGEGEIDYESTSGNLTFKDDHFTTFSGSLDLNFTSEAVVIKGRKISDVGCVEEQWEDYSEQAYECARVARWR